MHNLTGNFNKILVSVNEKISEHLNYDVTIERKEPKPKFSDAEIIAPNITAECFMLDSENYLFKLLNN